MKKLWRFLRSRRFAVWAIIVFAGYSAIATVFSPNDFGAPYRHPLFLVIAGLLTMSTMACAWERTRAASRSLRMSTLSDRARGQLLERPDFVLDTRETGLDAVEQALRGLRLTTRREHDAVQGRAGIGGALGSPVFHWSLALLFVVVALGQLTRTEGLMGVMAESQKPDAEASYGRLDQGPLSVLTGRVIAVGEIESNYVENGMDQGVTPYVEIRSSDGSRVLAAGYAYPNHPIRYRSMLVHANDDGLAALIEVTGGGSVLTEEVLLDYDEKRERVEPALFGVTGTSGVTAATIALEPAEGSTPERRLVRIRSSAGVAAPLENPDIDQIVPEGEAMELPGSLTLRIVRLGKYARLSVVNDWSVYPIYALFGLALVGLVLALFAPPKAVRVLLVEAEDGPRLHIAVRHSRGDPHFPDRVRSALSRARGMEEEQ